MNQEQLLSLLRTVLKVVGASVVAHGTMGINGAAWEQISGAIMMLAPIAWDMYVHTDAAKIAAVTAMPDVAKIVPTVNAAPTSAVAVAAADSAQPKVVAAPAPTPVTPITKAAS